VNIYACGFGSLEKVVGSCTITIIKGWGKCGLYRVFDLDFQRKTMDANENNVLSLLLMIFVKTLMRKKNMTLMS
jgi:hypothetical protein